MDFTLTVAGRKATVTTTVNGRDIVMDEWPSASLKTAAADLTQHGWSAKRQPRSDQSQVAVSPTDLPGALSKLVARRDRAKVELDAWHAAFKQFVLEDARPLGATEIARQAGLGRHRIYQIWNPELDRPARKKTTS